jgi:hypothetical protein
VPLGRILKAFLGKNKTIEKAFFTKMMNQIHLETLKYKKMNKYKYVL